MRILFLLITTAASTYAASVVEVNDGGSLRHPFSKLDKNGDDIVSLEELKTALKLHIAKIQDLDKKETDKKIKFVFNNLDKKKDGKLSNEDFESHINFFLEYFLSSVDNDGNHKISLTEVKTRIGLSRIEIPEQNIDDIWLNLMKSLDKNDDNQISLDEIEEIVKDLIQMALHAVDRDGDDKVSLEELKHIANPDTLPETLVSLFDGNGDGGLSYTEFKQVGDLDIVNTVTQALGCLDGETSGGMSSITMATGPYASSVTDGVINAVLRILFSILDRDGDDIFSLEELSNLLKDLNLSDKRIKSAFVKLDKSKDDKLSYEEVESLSNLALEYGFNNVLSSVDMNRNRKISLNEIHELTNEWFERLPWAIGLQIALQKEINDVWAKLIKRVDKDSDNEISLDEIKEIVKDVTQMALHTVDMDGNDKVSLEELKHIANPDTLPKTLMSLFDENGDGELSFTEFKQVGDTDVINTVTQALERLGGDGGMSGGAVAAVDQLLVGGSVAGYFVCKMKGIIG